MTCKSNSKDLEFYPESEKVCGFKNMFPIEEKIFIFR